MKYLLFFHLENDFGVDTKLVSNNEKDLEDKLTELGFEDIKFSYLKEDYGTCSLRNQYGTEVAKCFYIPKI